MTNSLKKVLGPSLLLVSFLLSSHSALAALIDLNVGAAAEAAPQAGNVVEVTYQEEGKFLALVPVQMKVLVRAYADGRVEVDYPWYSFLTVNKRHQIEGEMKVALGNTLRSGLVGSVQAEGQVENPSFTAEQSADVTEAMKDVLKANVDASVSVGVE